MRTGYEGYPVSQIHMSRPSLFIRQADHDTLSLTEAHHRVIIQSGIDRRSGRVPSSRF